MSSLREILQAVLSWRIWWLIALDDVVGRYRRTALGPAWLIIAQALWIAGIYILRNVWSHDTDPDYLWLLTGSVATWMLIANVLNDAPFAFVRSKGFIESYPLPLPIYLIRSVAGSVVTFAHLITIYVAVSVFQRKFAGLPLLQLVPGWLILLVFAMGVELGLAPLGARFRDIGPTVNSVMNMLFIVTPVFWIPTQSQAISPIVSLNPFYYILEVARGPLGGHWVPLHIWVGAILISALSMVLGLITYVRMRPAIMFWL